MLSQIIFAIIIISNMRFKPNILIVSVLGVSPGAGACYSQPSISAVLYRGSVNGQCFNPYSYNEIYLCLIPVYLFKTLAYLYQII